MKHGKRELPRKRKPLLTRVLLTTLVLGLAVVGVAAYLSHSSNELKNTFEVESHPVVTVSDTGITISNLDYAVYLRAAVVVNWENTTSGNILAVQPVAGTDYTLTESTDWIYNNGVDGDGFYYYKGTITSNGSVSLPVAVTPKDSKDGYELKVSIAAQTVQAVGQTDETDAESPVDAVYDAWGETAANLLEGASS